MWRPISTVPHDDDSLVLLWAPYTRVMHWAWSDDRLRWEMPGSNDPCFWREADDGKSGPTHWMPMPTPPVYEVQPVAKTRVYTTDTLLSAGIHVLCFAMVCISFAGALMAGGLI